ncbi:MAG: discoidin domain-containing protein [Verrucomicrobiota bacterium]
MAGGSSAVAAEGPGIPNIAYTSGQTGTILSIVNPGKAVSSMAMHRGYMFVPLSADHGGGQGAGAFAFYDVSDPSNPVNVFDSRNDNARYHTPGGPHYVGDWAELHHLPASGDLFMISERRNGSAGYCLFNAAPLYDEDPATKPEIISRYSFSGVTNPSNYDGYSFAPGWQGSRYLFAPTGAQGLYVINTSDIANPVQVAHISRAALGNVTLRAAWPIGNMLILCEADTQNQFQARVFDISNPATPVQTGAFGGPFSYNGFVYGSSFYNASSPLARYDFTDPSNVVETILATPVFDRPEYGFGKDGDLFVGHYPGGTRWHLSGNTASFVSRVDSGLIDDHAFLNPLGNLLAVCSDHNNDRKIMIGISGPGNDSSPPLPLFTSPADGAVGQNVLSRIGISFSDWVDPKSVTSSTVEVRKLETGSLVAGTYSVMMGIVNFAPDAPLELNSTYDVVLKAGGVKDQVGNSVASDTLVSRFSTGSQLTDFKVVIQPTTPVAVGQQAQLALTVTNTNGLALEHSWNFGDGSGDTAFSAATAAAHNYSLKGNLSLSVRTRIAGTTYSPSINGVQVVHGVIPAQKPKVQSTILADPDRTVVWNVNPDNDSVSGIDTELLVRIHETAVGDHPVAVAFGSQDRLWVANKNSASLSVINRATGAVTSTHELPRGSQPHGLVADPDAGFVYVALESLGEVAKISESTGQILARIPVGPWPRNLSLDPVRGTLWVSRFISPDEGGVLVPVELATFTAQPVVPLSPVMQSDGLQSGRGIPNYLAAVTISPDYSQAFVPSKKDNIFRGLNRDGQPLTFEHSVRSMAANLDPATRTEIPANTLDFDNSDFATAAAYSPLGNMVFFTTSGSSTVWAADAYNPSSNYTFESGGLAPDGLAVNADGTRIYIHNFMDRSVTVFRSTVACGAVCGTAPQIAKIPTVSTEALAPAVLRGKQIFYDTTDPRLAQEGYMSCASCHLDGGHDGRVWDFTNLGEGLRNTIDLNGRGLGHGAVHWTGNFDESQDFEGQIRVFSQGGGILSDTDFHQGSRSLSLGESKAGLSADLDALASYIGSLTKSGVSPRRAAGGGLTPGAVVGREIFRQENCASCHGGTAFSDSSGFARHDVGTLTSASGMRLGLTLDGLDTPTLRGVWKSAPYLHDGSAATLTDVLVGKDLSGKHGALFHRSPVEIAQLVEYLKSIDDLELEAPASDAGAAPVIAGQPPLAHPIHRSLSVTLTATGQGPFTWSGLALPSGLEIDPSTGIISGAPSSTGTFTARIGVHDASGRSSSMDIDWTIFDSFAHRYVKLISHSSHNGQSFSSMADFNLLDADYLPMDRTGWVATASSEETILENGRAIRTIDNSTGTFWHTKYNGGSTPFPHELVIDLGVARSIYGFTSLPRQDGSGNGRIRAFSFHFSDDGISWTAAVAEGSFANSASLQTVYLDSSSNRYVKLASLSSQNPTQTFTTLAEFNLLDAAGQPISRSGWQATASTEEPTTPASRTIDNQTGTFWHSAFSIGTPPFPHELIIDMGAGRTFHGFSALPRQDGNSNGRIKNYRFYSSQDGINWGTPVVEGELLNLATLQKVMFSNLVNKVPVFGAAPALSVIENSVAGIAVGTASATDPNVGQTLSYSLGSGNIGNAFVINPVTGEIRASGLLDYEARPIYQLQVIATDSGTPALSSSAVYPVTILNVIESNDEAVRIELAATGGIYEGHGNPALTGFNADPDRDGVSNAIEVLLGTDPSVANAQPPIRPVILMEAGQTWLAYEYDIAEDSGLEFRCMGSGDLKTWVPLENAPLLVSSSGGIQT